MKLVYALPLLALLACHPALPPDPDVVETPTPAPPYNTTDRDGIGTPIGDACMQLRKVGCPEGGPTKTHRTCFEHLTTFGVLHVDVPIACVTASVTKDDVRACGDDNTLRFRCID